MSVRDRIIAAAREGDRNVHSLSARFDRAENTVRHYLSQAGIAASTPRPAPNERQLRSLSRGRSAMNKRLRNTWGKGVGHTFVDPEFDE